MRRRTFVAAGIAALTAGCSAAKSNGPPVKVTLRTSYGVRGQDAYAYVALEKDFFSARPASRSRSRRAVT